MLSSYVPSVRAVVLQLSVELLKLVILILEQFAVLVLKVTLPLQSLISSLKKDLVIVSDTLHMGEHFVVPIDSFFLILLRLELLVSHIEFLH